MLALKSSALRHQLLMCSAGFAALSLDALTKYAAHLNLKEYVREVFIPHLLNFVLVANHGLAFSVLNQNVLVAKLTASIMFAILLFFYLKRYFWEKSDHFWLEQLGMSIIIGAASGNLLERFAFGHVTDFLEFAFMSFPVFNLADVLIDVGIGLVLISLRKSKKNEKAAQSIHN